jgi:hypothetical protein
VLSLEDSDMKAAMVLLLAVGGLVWWMLFGEPQYDDRIIAQYPLDDAAGLAHQMKSIPHEIDYSVSSDGNGSLRIDFARLWLAARRPSAGLRAQ